MRQCTKWKWCHWLTKGISEMKWYWKKWIRRNWTPSIEMVKIPGGCNNSIRNTSLYNGFFLHFSNWMNDADDERSSILKREWNPEGKMYSWECLQSSSHVKIRMNKKRKREIYIKWQKGLSVFPCMNIMHNARNLLL